MRNMVSGFVSKGVPAGDYRNHRIKTAVRLYEGDLKYDNSGFTRSGRKDENYHLSEPLNIGRFIKPIYKPTKSGAAVPTDTIIVGPADSSKDAFGRIINYPNIRSDIGWSDNELDGLPHANAEWGDFIPRSASVEWFGPSINQFKVRTGHDAINAGDYLEIVYDNEIKDMVATKSDGKNSDWLALESLKSNAGGYVRALALR